MLKTLISSRWFHPLLLCVWIGIGAVLRCFDLAGKPPWTDEFATLVFSLGNSFQTVPLDQAISLDTLLQPLQFNPSAGASQVIHHLISEDHHPPLYFVLAHWWMHLFPTSDGYVSLWAARSLPAFLGVASIPAVYGLGFLAFRSLVVAQLTAAMMAVSPYGVFLTQEARHYALGIVWVIASLSCLVVAMQHLNQRKPLPIWVALCWVLVNSFGIATHYFFSLTLCAEAIVLISFGILASPLAPLLKKFFPIPNSPFPIPHSLWLRIYAVAAGTFVSCLVWVPVWQMSYDNQMTQWIMSGERTFLSAFNPIFQSLAAWITMLALLPVESPKLPVIIASGVVMLIFFIWALPIFWRGLKVQMKQPETRLAIGVLGGFVLGAIAIFFTITYFFGTDLTRGARYNFVYFPALIVLLGATLASHWNTTFFQTPISLKTRSKTAVILIWFMGLLSAITVVSNLGYQKYYRPDLFVPEMQKASSVPIFIATTHNTLVQTGEMMGLAWEFKHSADAQQSRLKPKFLLAHQEQETCVNTEGTTCPANTTLGKAIAQLQRPLDLWLVNFKAPVVPEPPNCFAEDTSQYQTSVNGYTARLYHCLADNSQASRSETSGYSQP